jgi:magnesium transporter
VPDDLPPPPRRDPHRPGAEAGAGTGPAVDDVRSAVVDCALYEAGERQGGPVDLETAMARAAACRDGFVWIGLHDPTAAVVEAIGRHFQLHPLAVEDAVHAHQRPKLEVYGDTLLLVLKTARYVDSEELVHIGEILVFAGPRFVVTVRHGQASPLHDVRLHLEQRPELLAIGPSAVLYAVADRVVDDYATVIEGLAEDVDQVEEDVFSEEARNPAERIYRLKREIVQFRRAAAPLATPMERLAARQTGLPVDPRTGDYFRDVHDHLIRDVDRIAAFDELLSGALQANLAELQMRDNADIRRISAWVAIIAVPTMVFGLYGMNFEHMPELGWRYGYPAVITVTFIVCLGLYARLRRSGWL